MIVFTVISPPSPRDIRRLAAVMGVATLILMVIGDTRPVVVPIAWLLLRLPRGTCVAASVVGIARMIVIRRRGDQRRVRLLGLANGVGGPTVWLGVGVNWSWAV